MTTDLTPEISACEQLERVEQVYSDHQGLATDLEGYRAKAAGALADQESALANQELTETEAANQIAQAQALRSVFEARIAYKEAALERLTAELSSVAQAATRELTKLIAVEVDKRTALVTQRVLEALDVDHDSLVIHQKLALEQHTAALPEYSRSIRAISGLRPSSYHAGQPGAASQAKTLIGNYKIFLKETLCVA
jgi:hypothetical protein